jgi:hypothetical protein
MFYLGSNDVSKIEIVDFKGISRRVVELREGEEAVSVQGLIPGVYIFRAQLRNGGSRNERVVIK